MRVEDFSPPQMPTLDDQRDALRKGLGRVFLWAASHALDRDLLLEAVLHDQRFDSQIDEERGPWLWRLIEASANQSNFQVPLLRSLQNSPVERDAQQICDIAYHYASIGCSGFREALYRYAEEQSLKDSEIFGERELLVLDGKRAFQFIAKLRGRSLSLRDIEFTDISFVETAVELLGKDYVLGELKGSSDGMMHCLAEAWDSDVKLPKLDHATFRRQRAEKFSVIPPQDVISAAKESNSKFSFRAWGQYAGEDSLKQVFESLLEEKDPVILTRLLSIFSDRGFPEFHPRLLDLCDHSDQVVKHRTYHALGETTHDEIRKYGLELVRSGSPYFSVTKLFVNNYRGGDEALLLEHLELPDDLDECHWMLMDIIKILEKNPLADSSALGLIAWFQNPCDNCRHDALKLLVNRQVAPRWLIEESRHDSNLESVSLAERSLSKQ